MNDALEQAMELVDAHAHESWKRGQFMDLAIHKPSRDALHEHLKTMQNDAYAEGRKDEAEERGLITEANYHRALQRVGHALGLPVGSDLLSECVPAIEALRRAALSLPDAETHWLYNEYRDGTDAYVLRSDYDALLAALSSQSEAR